jgi:hypothetical protein
LSKNRKRKTGRCSENQLSFEQFEPRQLLATFAVTSNADSGAGSLRDAITQANAASGADTITFDATVFTGGDDSLIRLTSGELEITDSLTIDGSTGVDVTITGDANDDDITDVANITDVAASFGGTTGTADDLLDDNSRVLNFSGDTGDLNITGLVITGGRTSESGGGIFSSSPSELVISSSLIRGNSVHGSVFSDGGGGVLSSSNLQLVDSEVSNNSVVVTNGGSFGGGGVRTLFGNVSLVRSVVQDNTVATAGAERFGTPEGGGVFSSGGMTFSGFGSVELIGSTVIGNSVSGSGTFAFGGGISVKFATVSVVDSTVSRNSVSGATATGGTTVGGGGIDGFGSSAYVVNSTISLNSLSGRIGSGGAFFADGDEVTVLNSTIVGNSVTASGGVFSQGLGGGVSVGSNSNGSDPTTTIRNSIVAGNIDDGSAPDLRHASDAPLLIENSLIGVGENLDGIVVDVGNQIGSFASPIDPLIALLADNGGPTLSHALLPGSPAIDAGDPMFDVNGPDGIVGTEDDVLFDQRGLGFDRVLGGRVDIGAFEVGVTPIAAPRVVLNKFDEVGVLARPDLWRTLAVTFDSDVSITANALALNNDTLGGVPVDISQATFEYDATTFTATWAFDSTDPLPAAFYTFTLEASLISANGFQLDGDRDGVGGDDLVGQHYVALPGDANLDGRVDVLGDGFELVGNLGTFIGGVWADGDFNGDDKVDVLGDAFILVANLGQSVIPPAAAASESFAATRTKTNITLLQLPTGSFAPALLGLPTAGIREDADDDERSVGTKPELEVTESLQLAGDQTRDLAFEAEFFGLDSILG